MIYTPQTKKALRMAFEAHKDQMDKSGLPYVFHLFHLAEQMKDEQTTAAALLHDVVEDSEYTFADLEKMGFEQPVLDALALLTHQPEVDYFDYVRKIRTNPIAAAVKKADLKHNSDLSRLNEVTQEDLERVEKYRKALQILEGNEE